MFVDGEEGPQVGGKRNAFTLVFIGKRRSRESASCLRTDYVERSPRRRCAFVMAFYHVNVDHSVVVLRPVGRFTERDLTALLQAVLDDARRTPQFDHVWDTRDIDELVMDADVISMYRTLLDENEARITRRKVAIVATRTLTRTFAAMLAQVSRKHPGTFQFFEGMEAVAEWTGVPDAALTSIPDRDWTEV